MSHFGQSTIRIGVLAALALSANARVTRLVVEHTEPLGRDGYEKLTGHFYGELDPKLPLNAIITDLEFAPRNGRGAVEYSATFTILKPIDLAKCSGLLLYLVPNRSHINLTGGGLQTDARKRGDVLVAGGWQSDIEPADGNEILFPVVARNPDGSSITGRVLARFAGMPANTNTLPILRGERAGTGDPATLDTSDAILTRRGSESGETIPLRRTDWAFADCTGTPFPGVPDPRKVCLKDGFDAAYLYELIYTAKEDPRVYGIGFAATRDLNSYLRYGDSILHGRIKWAISQGSSQSGNFIRSLIHLGFNEDESGRIVFDGSNPNIAGRQLALNIRFGAPSGTAAMYEAGSDGAVWWEDYADEARGRPSGGLLDRCRATKTCPKIVETFGSLRVLQSSCFTGSGRHARRSRSAAPIQCPPLLFPRGHSRRRHPRLDRGELVAPVQSTLKFPLIPGVPLPYGILTPFYDYDFGPHFRYNDDSGVMSLQPPIIRQILPTLVPQLDADGNEVGGVASVLHQTPLGTYTGWNIISSGFYKCSIGSLTGGYIPFARTKADRLAAGDPRPSLEERYGNHEGYVKQARAAAERSVRERFLLRDDADRLIREAESSHVLRLRRHL